MPHPSTSQHSRDAVVVHHFVTPQCGDPQGHTFCQRLPRTLPSRAENHREVFGRVCSWNLQRYGYALLTHALPFSWLPAERVLLVFKALSPERIECQRLLLVMRASLVSKASIPYTHAVCRRPQGQSHRLACWCFWQPRAQIGST